MPPNASSLAAILRPAVIGRDDRAELGRGIREEDAVETLAEEVGSGPGLEAVRRLRLGHLRSRTAGGFRVERSPRDRERSARLDVAKCALRSSQRRASLQSVPA